MSVAGVPAEVAIPAAAAGLPAPLAAAAEPTGQPESAQLRKLVGMCSHLSALASQAADLTPIVEVLAAGIGSGVAVVDQGLQTLAFANVTSAREITGRLAPGAADAKLRAVLATAARTRRALAVPDAGQSGWLVIVAPVSVGDEVVGHVLTAGSREAGLPADMRLLATEHAAMLCGVVLGRELVAGAAAGRARQQLIEGLILSRDPADPELDRWARYLGLDFGRPHFVIVLALPEPRPGSMPSPAELQLAGRAPDAVVAARSDEIVGIVPVGRDGRSPADQGRALGLACLAGEGQRTGVSGAGIGSPGASAAEIARSYAEARHALAAGRRMGRAGTVAAFADLGVHRLLLRVPNVGDLWEFADEVLGALRREERVTGIEYLRTLSVYFQESGSPRRAAERLHLHPNTVSYRLRRAEELTGLSLGIHRDRLMAEIAAEIMTGLEVHP
jgi:PucR C-terminal helix-turn-helix domain/GGDEF-like domain